MHRRSIQIGQGLAFTALAAFALAVFIAPHRVRAAAESHDQVGSRTGAALFAKTGCEHCHGAAGIGGNLGPDLTNVGKRLSPRQIAKQITLGGKAMPAFKGILSSGEIARLVVYLRTPHKAAGRSRTLPMAMPRHTKMNLAPGH